MILKKYLKKKFQFVNFFVCSEIPPAETFSFCFNTLLNDIAASNQDIADRIIDTQVQISLIDRIIDTQVQISLIERIIDTQVQI